MRIFLRLLILFLAVSTVLSRFRRFFAGAARTRPEPRLRPSGGGRLVKDPVCGMYVPEETAIRAGEQCFCSEACRDKYVS
jgi:hypothetical protein